MTYHVASRKETRTLLPLTPAIAEQMLERMGISTEWMVSDESGTIEWGKVTHTETGRSFTFEVLRVDGGFEMLPLSGWQDPEES